MLHVSSGAAHGGAPGMAPYCASKAALKSVYESLRDELRPRHILVGSAMPGVADTPMQTALLEDLAGDHPMRAYFEDLRATTPTSGSPSPSPRPPPDRGLDAPSNVAAFLNYLLFDCPDDDFGAKDHDIQDPEHHARWAR